MPSLVLADVEPAHPQDVTNILLRFPLAKMNLSLTYSSQTALSSARDSTVLQAPPKQCAIPNSGVCYCHEPDGKNAIGETVSQLAAEVPMFTTASVSCHTCTNNFEQPYSGPLIGVEI